MAKRKAKARKTSTSLLTGGCQCGAVRYAIPVPTKGVHLCHCRMCQKAVGNYFAALAPAPRDQLIWTRGAPTWFRSSTAAERGFCKVCGTPLTFAYVGGKTIHISIGSLDNPDAVTLDVQYGVEARRPAFDSFAALPAKPTDSASLNKHYPSYTSFQHPDHDTTS